MIEEIKSSSRDGKIDVQTQPVELGRVLCALHAYIVVARLSPGPVPNIFSVPEPSTGLENTGEYTWRLERHVPDRFYLRLEARDIAGNLAAYQTPAPIMLNRPQPTGRLRGVQPVAADPRPYDTAENRR